MEPGRAGREAEILPALEPAPPSLYRCGRNELTPRTGRSWGRRAASTRTTQCGGKPLGQSLHGDPSAENSPPTGLEPSEMNRFQATSRCECQALLTATLDEKRHVIEGSASPRRPGEGPGPQHRRRRRALRHRLAVPLLRPATPSARSTPARSARSRRPPLRRIRLRPSPPRRLPDATFRSGHRPRPCPDTRRHQAASASSARPGVRWTAARAFSPPRTRNQRAWLRAWPASSAAPVCASVAPRMVHVRAPPLVEGAGPAEEHHRATEVAPGAQLPRPGDQGLDRIVRGDGRDRDGAARPSGELLLARFCPTTAHVRTSSAPLCKACTTRRAWPTSHGAPRGRWTDERAGRSGARS